MKTGELASLTDTSIETIRFYEHEGMLPKPQRSSGNYRIYDDSHAERLAFIRHCRSLDMTLEEVRVLLRFKDAPCPQCGEVDTLLDEHIGHVAARIRELKGATEAPEGAAPTVPRPRGRPGLRHPAGIDHGIARDQAGDERRGPCTRTPRPCHEGCTSKYRGAKVPLNCLSDATAAPPGAR